MRRWIKLCALALLLIWLCSCTQGGGSIRYFSYLDAPAHCAVSGSINGTPFTATLQSEGRTAAKGELAECTAGFTLTYLSPAALAGVRVTYDGEGGSYRVTLGELYAEGEEYAVLGAVGKILLTESAVSTTTQAEGDRVLFETMDGATRMLDVRGRPVRVRWCDGGRRVEVEISEWEQE